MKMDIHSGFPMKNGDFPWLCKRLPEGNLLVPEGNLLVPEDFPGSSRTIFLVQQVVAPAAAENGWNGPGNFDPQPLEIGSKLSTSLTLRCHQTWRAGKWTFHRRLSYLLYKTSIQFGDFPLPCLSTRGYLDGLVLNTNNVLGPATTHSGGIPTYCHLFFAVL